MPADGQSGNDNAVDFQAVSSQIINQAKHIHIISNAKVTADLIALNIPGIDADNNFCLIFKLLKQFDLCVFVKTGKDSLGVEIVNQFTTKFKVEFVVIVYPFQNILGLLFDVLFVIKSDFHNFLLARLPLKAAPVSTLPGSCTLKFIS